MIEKIALVAAVILPLWNIPMIVRIIRRKSSKDVSLFWAIGVWVCLALMFPAGLRSNDIVWKTFNIINIILFTGVAFCAILYHKERK